jgi:hypothetical protein
MPLSPDVRSRRASLVLTFHAFSLSARWVIQAVVDLSNEYCGRCKSAPPKPPLPSPLNRELNLPRTLVLWSRYHRYIKYCRTLARPNLTPVVFLEDHASSAKWPALTGRPLTFGRGLFLFKRLRRRLQPIPFRRSTKPRRHLFPSKIRDVNIIALAHVTPMRMVRAVERTILRNH